MRNGGWIRTLCDKHAEEHGYDLEYDGIQDYLPFGNPNGA